ncbi:hypothetical protein M6B38_300085 [Iris pallida]|uniref:Uncharacterized protein n=1 Tax=Iris pallida TaxID=29817 RepID=A0AAX6HQJ9_IRIPA|nr:hypothetical protein M6B38_300085 [Iris pallida]
MKKKKNMLKKRNQGDDGVITHLGLAAENGTGRGGAHVEIRANRLVHIREWRRQQGSERLGGKSADRLGDTDRRAVEALRRDTSSESTKSNAMGMRLRRSSRTPPVSCGGEPLSSGGCGSTAWSTGANDWWLSRPDPENRSSSLDFTRIIVLAGA